MSGALVMEVSYGDGPWQPGPSLTPADQEGSVSHNWPDGKRDLILFRCCGHYSVIRLSAAGADYEDGAARIVRSAGFHEVARLEPGENFDMAITSDGGVSYRARWTHRDGSQP